MLFEVILDEIEFEYITGLIEQDIQRNEGDPLNNVKEGILENLRYFYRHFKVKDRD